MHSVLNFEGFNESFLDGNYAPLYHCTYLTFLKSILEYDLLRANEIGIWKTNTPDPEVPMKGVSLTRSDIFWYNPYVRFMLDQSKLRQVCKIVPYNWHKGEERKEEFEESVVGKISPLSRFLLEIQFHESVSQSSRERFADAVFDYTQKHPHVKVKVFHSAVNHFGDYVNSKEEFANLKRKFYSYARR